MSNPRKIRMMISSQCDTKYPFTGLNVSKLSDIRKRLKKEIEDATFLGEKVCKVWINENATQNAGQTWWDACIEQAEKCDVMLVINSGSAGNQLDGKGIGICHAEFAAALAKSPKKIYVLTLTSPEDKVVTRNKRDRDFQESLKSSKILEARDFQNVDELVDRAKLEASRMLMRLALEGAFFIRGSGENVGEALDWSRMDYSERSAAMTNQIVNFIKNVKGGAKTGNGFTAKIGGQTLYFRPAAVPAAFSIPAARERVGQPFLEDHLHSSDMEKGVGGPIHLIACHKGVTEAQALGLLGFPDATVIDGSFGIYVADKIQKIQLCFISNCRDAAATEHGLQRFFEWLERSGENQNLISRARSRARILAAIAKEVE